MKKTDLDKNKGLKINSRMKHAGPPDRFGKESAAAALSRKEQRKLDQERGLVPFAVKLDGELVKRLNVLAAERQTELGELVSQLLHKGLES